MAGYADQLSTLALFKELRASASRDGIGAADVEILAGMVLEVADRIGPLLKRISHTFKQYTEHDFGHCLNIINLMGRFIPKETTNELNGLELAVLILSSLLHDAGMVVTDEEKAMAMNSGSFRSFAFNQRDRWEAAEAARRAGNNLRAVAIEDAVLADYFRRIHPERAHDFVRKHLDKALVFRDFDISSYILQVSESHSWGVFDSLDSRHLENAVAKLDTKYPVSGVAVNLQYLACCLRLGDIMDFDRSRTPVAVFQAIDFTEPKSWQEWNKHLQVSGWIVDDREVVYAAKCTHPAFYVAVMEFLDSIDAELRDCHRLVVNVAPHGVAEKYCLHLVPLVDRSKVEMADKRFVAGAFHFQLDYERIFQLLMDKSLYPDPSLFLRELLQNSLDACRIREAVAKSEGSADSYEPRIAIWDHSEDPADPRIVFQDNGVGMSLKIVEEYFMQVGRSYYRSTQFDAERDRLSKAGIELEACSCFGIGILSCFLVADRFEVESYRVGSKPLHLTIEGPTKYFIVELSDEPDRVDFASKPSSDNEDGPPNRPGTRITVHLRSGSKLEVFEVLSRLAVNIEYGLTVYRSGHRRPQRISSLIWDSRRTSLDDLAKSLGDRDALRFRWDEPEWALVDLGANPELAKSLRSILVASRVPFEKYPFSRHLRGRAWLWLLRNESGEGSPATGYLIIRQKLYLRGLPEMLAYATRAYEADGTSTATCGDFAEKLENCIGMDFDRFASSPAYQALCDMYNDNPKLDEDYGPGELRADEFGEIWAKLREDEQRAACRSLASHDGRGQHWFNVPEVVRQLAAGSLDWTARPLNFHKDVDMDALPQTFAIHGVLLPAGLVGWNPMNAYMKRIRLLAAPGGLRIDARSSNAPRPAASRLFVESSEAGKIGIPFARACLRHAGELAMQHAGDPEWRRWFFAFVYSSRGLLFWPEAVRQEIDLLEQLLKHRVWIADKSCSMSRADVVQKFGRWAPISHGERTKRTEALDIDSYETGWLLACRPKRKRPGKFWEVDMEDTIPPLGDTLSSAEEAWRKEMQRDH
jgi:hypothetical protein